MADVVKSAAKSAGAATVFDLLADAAACGAPNPSIEDGAVRLDAAALMGRVGRRARALLERGVRHGDRVLICAPNGADAVVSLLAVMRCGAIAAPFNPAATARERRIAIEIIAPAGVIADAASAWKDIAPVLSDLGGDATHAHDDQTAPALPSIDAADRALILFTSGTTGRPKAVVQSHATLLYAGQGTAHWLELGGNDVLLACLPMFHANGIYYSLMGALVAGARLAIAPRFSVSTFWRTVRRTGATEVNLLGPMLTMLLRQPPLSDDGDNPLRLVYTAAAPVDVCARFAARFGVDIVEGYGMTETPYGCINPRRGGKPGSIGLPRQHPARAFANAVAIADEHGDPMPDGGVGEIVIRNAATLVEYWNDPAATAGALRNGWLRTGDIGYRDADGYFYIVGRAKEIIRRKGVNIAPAEIEGLLREIPGVSDAALIGAPSDLGEEDAVAIVVVDPPLRGDGAEARILSAIRELTSREKWPDEVVLIDELPKTPTHRIERGVLKEWLEKKRKAGVAKPRP